MYNKGNHIRFKTLMLRSSLFDYSDGCILVKGTTKLQKQQLQHQERLKYLGKIEINLPLRHWNTELVSSGASLTSCGEGASLALEGYYSSDGVTVKTPYGVDFLHWPALLLIFSYWLKLNVALLLDQLRLA